jgi:hypothetical protein
MELVLSKVKPISEAVLREITIAGVIAIGYFSLCVINPFQAFSAVASLTGLTNVRIADVLRARALTSVGAAAGVAFGAHYYNVYTGKIAIGAYPIIPLIILGIWMFVQGLSKAWGRSFAKDLALIGLAGFLTGVVVTLNLAGLAILLHGTIPGKLMTIGALWKVATHTLVPMVGYSLFKQLRG